MTDYQRIREANKGIAQQMILWGYDVKHPHGNLLLQYGMTRHESTGLKGTSCYLMPWENGWVQLHGACACWFHTSDSKFPGCLYQRTSRRIKLWCNHHAPVPGKDGGKYANADIVWPSAQPFLRWLLAYETWVMGQYDMSWRQKTWRAQFSLTNKQPWLPPNEALLWWRSHVMRSGSLITD